MLGYLKLEITIFGCQSWSFKATFHEEISIENEATNNYAPIWIWWPEFFTALDLPSSEVFSSDEAFDQYNDQFLSGDIILGGSSSFRVMPSIPGREWKDEMSWSNVRDNRKSDLMTFLLGVLEDNEMKPMEFLAMCIIYHPGTPVTEAKLVKSIFAKKAIDLPVSLSDAAGHRLRIN